MKNLKTIITLMLLSLYINALANNELKIEGVFKGKNIYVSNPYAASGVGFCVYEVIVNGNVCVDELNKTGFEIDLSPFHLSKGDPVTVIIKHKDDCKPKIVNPEDLKAVSSFTMVSAKVTKTGKLIFNTQDETGALPFVVEQFKWKKWVAVAQIDGKGTSGINTYTVQVPLHSGINKYRIKQVDASKKPRYSTEIIFDNKEEAVTFTPGNGGQTSDKVVFSRSTEYEIYDFYGKRVLKGNGESVDVSKIANGTYFINYDCKSESFEKK